MGVYRLCPSHIKRKARQLFPFYKWGGSPRIKPVYTFAAGRICLIFIHLIILGDKNQRIRLSAIDNMSQEIVVMTVNTDSLLKSCVFPLYVEWIQFV